jgi:MFS family permease
MTIESSSSARETVEVNFKNLTSYGQIKYISRAVWKESLSDWKYPLSYLGAMVNRLVSILFSIYLLLWVTSFVESGIVESEAEAMAIYQKIILISVIGTMLSLPLIGWMADKVPEKLMIPLSFFVRMVTAASFLVLDHPESTQSICLCAMLIVTSLFENISIDAMFFRTLPRDIRGSMIALFLLMSLVGILLFTEFAGRAFDILGPSSPFAIVAVCDAFVFLFSTFLACTGRLKGK